MYSDLHLRPEKMVECETALNSVLQIALKLREVSKKEVVLINGGDTFNTRGLIKTSCFDTLYRHYFKWANEGFRQLIVVGNHDQEDREGVVHPMRVFNQFKDWTVADAPMQFDQFMAIPYMTMDKIKTFFASYEAKGKHDAIVHWGIQGALRNDRNRDADGVPLEWLDVFRNVFSGHYHYRNAIGNVQYIGSPFQQNHGEMDQAKGVLIYNSETLKTAFREIKGTPKHVDVQISWDSDGKIILPEVEVNETDIYRVKATGFAVQCGSLTKDVLKDALGMEPSTIEREVKEMRHSRLKIDTKEIYDTEMLMERYVEFVDLPLDRDRLMKVGLEIVRGD